jgi:hypothetical protein
MEKVVAVNMLKALKNLKENALHTHTVQAFMIARFH